MKLGVIHSESFTYVECTLEDELEIVALECRLWHCLFSILNDWQISTYPSFASHSPVVYSNLLATRSRSLKDRTVANLERRMAVFFPYI